MMTLERLRKAFKAEHWNDEKNLMLETILYSQLILFAFRYFLSSVRAVITIACLLVTGCIGDRIYTSNIDILFPGKTKEQARSLVLEAGSACGYKKGGHWESSGLSLYDTCGQVRDNWSGCVTKFKKNAVWVEAKDQTTAKMISFWLDLVDSEGWIVLEPEVKIEDVVGGSKVQFSLSSLGTPLSPKEETEFHALKRCFTSFQRSALNAKEDAPASW